jgi:hypothetical protein
MRSKAGFGTLVWVPHNRGHFHTVDPTGGRWDLKATPRAKYPWMLVGPGCENQPIGAPEELAARAVAEVHIFLEPLLADLPSAPD